MAHNLLSGFKLSQLKSLAFQCGLLTSGTKNDLASRITHQIKPLETPFTGTLNHGHPGHERANVQHGTPVRLLSIDMGIRNLAYCMLHLPPSFPSATKAVTPAIQAWHRTSISRPSFIPPLVTNLASETKMMEIHGKEDFSPAALSSLAYSLLKDTLLPLAPTHILIERQRFRSMGSKHILEWTIRVNTLESMLYSTLHTLKHERLWDGQVIPVLPGKVGGFWLPDLSKTETKRDVKSAEPKFAGNAKEGKVRKTSNAKLLNKGAKIDLVRSWLEKSNHPTCPLTMASPQAISTAEQYLETWHRAPGRRKKSLQVKHPAEGSRFPPSDPMTVLNESIASLDAAEHIEADAKAVKGLTGTGPEKLDDLADCLLQGMAWVKWEENKKTVLEKGWEALDLSMEPRTLRGV